MDRDEPIDNVYQDFQVFARARGREHLEALASEYGLDLGATEELLDSLLAQGEFLALGQSVTGLKAPDTKIGFGKKRDDWKMNVELGVESIYNELVNIVDSVN